MSKLHNRHLSAAIGVGVLTVTLTAVLVSSGAVGAYNGINKGITVGDYGLELVGEPGVFHNADTVPPCAQEDSAGPCYWDAGTMGNGMGQSFTVDAQQVVHYESEGN